MTHRRKRLVGVALVTALLLAACTPTTSTAITPSGLERGADGWRGLPVEDASRLPDATLVDVDGEPFVLPDDLLGTPALVFFGYTNCPDICPIHLAAIAAAMRMTETSFDDLAVVFITVDPDRDTPEQIRTWLSHFDARMIGLHGELDTIEDALAQLDMPGPVVEGDDPRGDGALLGHPAQVIGFDADGEAQRMWPFGTRRSDWVDDLPRIVEEWS